MLTRFGFRRKMVYLCTSKEERAHKQRVFSSFFDQKNGIFTSEVENFLSESGVFFSESGFFLGVCGRNFADIEDGKLKYIYFFGYTFNISRFYSG